ncbi:hypothetical protein KEM60_00419 [Austwickia sp. TVS 96-490-7B]|uniref:ABC transporter permease subunit n=1 Tax=Austwickia sp. TVS 96-490-7B TaxID=2830843 RepID=UPI001C576790|nr:ABC transporter permease subunit [Austwickia sp. TVS 96-490-7B]MBW3084233.1 hypothetical protein [Austwickia sp. TVS 96-490-7B]
MALHLGVGAANVLAVLIVLVEALGGWDLFGMTGRHVMAVLTGSQSAALADTVLAALVSTMVTVSLAWWWGVRMVADTIESRISMGFWQAMPTLVCGLGAWVAVTRWTGPLMEISPWELPVSELMTWFFLLVVMVLSSLPGLTGTIADRASTVPTSLVGSAHALGAGAGAVRREVVFPHVRPVLAAQLPVTLARSLGALGPAALLATPRTPLLPVEMITAAEAGRLSDACAMALVTGVLVAACISLTIKTAAVVVDR